MKDVFVLLIIFGSCAVTAICWAQEKTKRTKLRLEAQLRQQEMESGIPSGTFSNLSMDNDSKKEREELEKAIEDLEMRLKALDTLTNRKG